MMKLTLETAPEMPFEGSVHSIIEVRIPDAFRPPAGVQVWEKYTGMGEKCDKHYDFEGVLTLFFAPERAGVQMMVAVI